MQSNTLTTSSVALDVLVVEDEVDIREPIAEALAESGHRVLSVGTGEQAIGALNSQAFDVVISDVRLPKVDGFAVFRHARTIAPATKVILMTAYGNVADAVAAIRDHAVEYLTKPFDLNKLLQTVDAIAHKVWRQKEVQEQCKDGNEGALIGRTPAIMAIKARLNEIADSQAPVLITGEVGVGKKYLAHAIFRQSQHMNRIFVRVNCAGFNEEQLTNELFGHVVNAEDNGELIAGRIADAHGGMLCLENFTETPMSVQGRLLSVFAPQGEELADGREGGIRLRVIATTTHDDIDACVQSQSLRPELAVLLKNSLIHLPTLHERRADIALWIEYFLQKYRGHGITNRAQAVLCEYMYPGNILELGQIFARAVALAAGNDIDVDHLPDHVKGRTTTFSLFRSAMQPLATAVEEFERQYLPKVLAVTRGNKSQAARILGISRKSLWAKLKRHALYDTFRRYRARVKTS